LLALLPLAALMALLVLIFLTRDPDESRLVGTWGVEANDTGGMLPIIGKNAILQLRPDHYYSISWLPGISALETWHVYGKIVNFQGLRLVDNRHGGNMSLSVDELHIPGDIPDGPDKTDIVATSYAAGDIQLIVSSDAASMSSGHLALRKLN